MPSENDAWAALWKLNTYFRPLGETDSYRRLYDLVGLASSLHEYEVGSGGGGVTAPFKDAECSKDEALAAFHLLQEYLKPLGTKGQIQDVEPMIEEAAECHAQEEPERREREAAHAVIKRLNGLKNTADHGEYYARNIREDLAAAWSKGEHRPKRKPRGWDEKVNATEINAVQDAAIGVTIEGAIDDFAGCLSILEGLDGDFANPIDAKTAEKVYDAYDDVST